MLLSKPQIDEEITRETGKFLKLSDNKGNITICKAQLECWGGGRQGFKCLNP